ncbi:hypothetical protein NC651_037758 [Populus alba x Populus x berolinensis]|nr:hypothetical protein NC651_037758 [Populus alba x Populus x berolinensis]
MGSQGKARCLTIIVLLIVTIILLSCPNLTVIARPADPCIYDPIDGMCHIGEPAAAPYDE